MQILTFLFMNFIVILSACLVTFKFFKVTDSIDCLISVFLFYFAQIILSELVLGLPGALFIQNVILANLIILLAIWGLLRNCHCEPRRGEAISFLRLLRSLRSLAMTQVKVFRNSPIWLAGREIEGQFSFSGIKDSIAGLLQSKLIVFISCLIMGFAAVKVAVNLANPPFGWDSLNYHFSFPVEWLKQGNLNNPVVVSDDPFPSYYPINGSLFFLWLILPFKNAFLADLAQLPFFIISFLAILSIGRKLGLSKEYSFLAGCLFVTIPNFFKQLGIGYVDIMAAGVFLIALNFILRLKEEFNLKNIILLAISFGIFIGTKTTVLAYGILLLLPFLYLVFLQKQLSYAAKSGYIILFFSLVFIFGCFSYMRNFVLTGNPFYPLDVTIGGRVLFKGVIDKATFIARNEKTGYSLAKLLFREGLGIQSSLIILPAAFFALPVGILIKKNKDLFLNYIITLPLLLYLVYRFILPIPNSRYLYPMLGAGVISGFYILSAIKIPLKIIRGAAFIIVTASSFEFSRRLELGISFALSLLLFVMLIYFLRDKRPKIAVFPKAGILALVILPVFLEISLLDYNKNEYSRYISNSRYWPDATSAWGWLNANTSRHNIAYVGRPVPYPLYGSNLKNNVYYVSVNSIEPIRLHDLGNSRYSWGSDAEGMHRSFEEPNNYRGNADYAVWLSNLHKKETDLLFIYSLHHTKDIRFPIEELWAKAHSEEFSLLFNNNTIRIYKLIK